MYIFAGLSFSCSQYFHAAVTPHIYPRDVARWCGNKALDPAVRVRAQEIEREKCECLLQPKRKEVSVHFASFLRMPSLRNPFGYNLQQLSACGATAVSSQLADTEPLASKRNFAMLRAFHIYTHPESEDELKASKQEQQIP